MRSLFIQLGFALALGLTACTGGDDPGGAGGDGDGDGSGGGDGFGGETGTGGTTGSEVEFEDLPGRIRFANFVSDGEAGVTLDLYWGGTLEESEFVDTLEYGEVSDFFTPRRPVDTVLSALLDPDEARYFIVLEGEMTSLPSEFLVMQDEAFDEETTITVGLSFAQAFSAGTLAISSQSILEHRMDPPGAEESHVYVWSGAFEEIPDGDFVQVAADGVCGPPTVGATANAGEAFVLSPDAMGLFLADANTDCASGSTPAEGSLEAGRSFLLMGKADTFTVEAREAVLLPLTVGE
jgi:hypothetical protein